MSPVGQRRRLRKVVRLSNWSGWLTDGLTDRPGWLIDWLTDCAADWLTCPFGVGRTHAVSKARSGLRETAVRPNPYTRKTNLRVLVREHRSVHAPIGRSTRVLWLPPTSLSPIVRRKDELALSVHSQWLAPMNHSRWEKGEWCKPNIRVKQWRKSNHFPSSFNLDYCPKITNCTIRIETILQYEAYRRDSL